MKHKRYEKYKDSGVKWIEEVPERWSHKKLKFLGHIKASNIDKKNEYEINTLVVHYNDVIKYPIINENIGLELTSCTKSQYNSFKLNYGDIIITKDSMDVRNIADASIIEDKKRDIVCGYHLFILSVSNNVALPKYCYYCLANENMKKHFLMLSVGTTIIGLSRFSLSNIYFPYPTILEQKAIANYLNQKTSEIDSLLSDKEKLIQRLQEYKQSVITEAVTKGLNPDVKMKDSGIEWIGEVPEHWEVIKLKYLTIKGFQNGLFKKKDEFGVGTKIINVFDIYQVSYKVNYNQLDRVYSTVNENKLYEVLNKDILFVRSSLKKEGVAASAIVKEYKEPLVFECHLVKMSPNQNIINPELLINYLNIPLVRDRLISLSQTITMTTISQPKISSLEIIVPNTKEQLQIALKINSIMDNINALVDIIQSQIEKLKEYRQSLIYEAVTGKIDVRDYAPERSEELAQNTTGLN